tara:strand:+ start:3962 stop:4549 length:588 start_codon:yes stop_codon:yes gene_type:complete
MEKKTIYQLSLASLLIIIITIIYLIYFNEKEISSIKEAVLNNREIEEGNLIEDLKYYSTDNKGNKYEIIANKGNLDKQNPDIIFMKDVSAVINLKDDDDIYIMSKNAKYNSKNHNTFFSEDVALNYKDHSLKSVYLDLSFEKNLVSIYENVNYFNDSSLLMADKAEIDLIKKKTKIFMIDPKKKVLIKNQTNGNN